MPETGALLVAKRHAYIAAIPFLDMKLNAPVLASYPMTSLSQCGARCLEKSTCQSFNYHRPTLRCELLGDYLCTEKYEPITAAGYMYYDVEKNETSMRVNLASQYCKLDARCSPKCPLCTAIAFMTFPERQLVPDDATSSLVPSSTSKATCMVLCKAKSLQACRGINTRENPHICQHIPFIKSERGPERYVTDLAWEYHKRACLIY